MNEKICTLLVIGTGTMGRGIAQTAATAGTEVRLYDAEPGVADGCKEAIAGALARAEAKGFLGTDSIPQILDRLTPASSLDACSEVDVVLEAVREDLETKRAVFGEVEQIAGPETYLWTNTSMLSISEIAALLRRPERVVGTHFFNPVPRMKLVEIIAGVKTSPQALAVAERTVTAWGKVIVRAPDSPGFIVNRVLDAIKREALALMSEGVPTEQIDTGVRLGLNFPMGPFELMDLVGLDTALACLETQAARMGRDKDVAPQVKQLVREGNLGRKSGKGFYSYGDR